MFSTIIMIFMFSNPIPSQNVKKTLNVSTLTRCKFKNKRQEDNENISPTRNYTSISHYD